MDMCNLHALQFTSNTYISNIYIFFEMMSKAEADIAFIVNRSIATPVVIIRTWLNQLLANCNYYSPRRIFVPRYFFFCIDNHIAPVSFCRGTRHLKPASA